MEIRASISVRETQIVYDKPINTRFFFDIGDRTQLIADTSPVGVGAILIQINSEGNPRVIAYASKSLSNTEKRYAQIEKEALALVWAVERFHF